MFLPLRRAWRIMLDTVCFPLLWSSAPAHLLMRS